MTEPTPEQLAQAEKEMAALLGYRLLKGYDQQPDGCQEPWWMFVDPEDNDLAEPTAAEVELYELLISERAKNIQLQAEVKKLETELYSACAECGSDDPELQARCPFALAKAEVTKLQAQLAAKEAELKSPIRRVEFHLNSH